MPKDFTNQNDVAETKKATKDNGKFIRIEEGKTPIYLLSSKYEDGFAHWVQLPSGDRVRIPCAGGSEGQGYAPDDCPLCDYMNDQFALARSLEGGGRFQAAKELKNHTNRLRAKFEVYFIAAKGELVVDKIVDGKKKFKVDFEDAQVGFLAFTKKQWEDLLAIPAQHQHISGTADLLNRYIIFDKRKRGDDEFNTVEFFPAQKPSPKPEVEWDEEELDLSTIFEVDMDQLTKAVAILKGDVEEADEEVDFEDDEEEELEDNEEIVEDIMDEADYGEEYEDDSEEDEEVVTFSDADEEDEEEPSSDFDTSFLDDVDDDFNEDLPWEKDDEEPAIPEEDKAQAPKKKSTATKKAPAKKKKKQPPKKTDF